jgi:arabinose-5-phosphate isomerase
MDKTLEIAQARRVLEIEAEAILRQRERLGPDFLNVVGRIAALRGKVVLTGIGKSGIVGMKVAATMASTGTPAIFIHPVEGVHGDIGVVSRDDLLMALSNSGETQEVLNLVVAVKKLGVPVVGVCGSAECTLARLCDQCLVVSVDREACPLGLAPTASTTAVLAVGDALAMMLSSRRRFTADDYAAFHPGGTLGRRLKLRVRDIMVTGEGVPKVREGQTFEEAIKEMTARHNLGVTLVVDGAGRLTGILTDGDLRRILLKGKAGGLDISTPIERLMTRNPKVIEAEALASEAMQMMEAKAITSLAVVDTESRPVGLIHLHDILGRGQVIF